MTRVASPRARLEVTWAATVQPERPRWAWAERIPLAAVTVIAGEGGLGKSTLKAHLAGLASRGRLKGDLHGQPVPVLIVSYEDHPAAVIRPRLDAAGADASLVGFLGAWGPDGHPDLIGLPDDSHHLEAAVRETRARLLFIDPLTAALISGKVQAKDDASVRRALAPLAALAERCDCAVIVVAHTKKGEAASLIDKVSGSPGFVNAARSVLVLARDPEDPDGEQGYRRVLVHAKSNWGRHAPALAAHVETANETSRLVIDGESTVRAADLTRSVTGEERTEADEAVEFLSVYLADGEAAPSREVKQAARAEGISERTLKRALQRAGVEVTGRGRGGSSWTLKEPGQPPGPPTGPVPWPNSQKGVFAGVSTSETGPENELGHYQGNGPIPVERPATDAEEADLQRARLLLASSHRHPNGATPCGCDGPIPATDADGEPACAGCGRRAR